MADKATIHQNAITEKNKHYKVWKQEQAACQEINDPLLKQQCESQASAKWMKALNAIIAEYKKLLALINLRLEQAEADYLAKVAACTEPEKEKEGEGMGEGIGEEEEEEEEEFFFDF